IVTFMRKNYNLLIGEPTAEAIKIQIGSAFSNGEEREMEVKGRDLVSGIPKTVRVHSQEIRECIQEPIQQIVEAVRRALEITPPELAADIVDRGIVMTGGGSLIRGLDQLLAHETGLPIHVDEEPLTCVVRGAGKILDDFEKYRSVLTTSVGNYFDGTRRGRRRDAAVAGGFLLVAVFLLLLPASYQAPLRSAIRGTALRPFLAMQAELTERRVRREDVSKLRAERDSLAAVVAAQASLAEENRRLRALLGLRGRAQPEFRPAELIRAGVPGAESTFFIDI